MPGLLQTGPEAPPSLMLVRVVEDLPRPQAPAAKTLEAERLWAQIARLRQSGSGDRRSGFPGVVIHDIKGFPGGHRHVERVDRVEHRRR
ncbi:hypothetical protein AAFN86_28470 [Roseomonas sp. CAU 1739]|uniref:hypothetical protein n=1 Tax=Roseomonas sp. CAU 1739 TaxID=3140364 RepID=UPI00325A4C83